MLILLAPFPMNGIQKIFRTVDHGIRIDDHKRVASKNTPPVYKI